MKSLDSVAYKQVRAGGFGVDPTVAAKRKRTAKAITVVIVMIVIHKLLTVMGWAA